MQLVRFQAPGGIAPGMIDDDRKVRDLSYVLMDIGPEHMSPDDLDILRSIEPATLPLAKGDAFAFAPPISGIGAIFPDFDGPQLTAVWPAAALPVGPAGYRAGVAAVIGCGAGNGEPPWAGAYMSVLTEPTGGKIAFGPFLYAPMGPLRLERRRAALTVDGTMQDFALPAIGLESAIAQATTARPGDVVLATLPVDVAPNNEIALTSEDLGDQIHHIDGAG